MTREIKPSTCTKFPVGTKVKIVSSGHTYTGYTPAADFMGVKIPAGINPFRNGNIGVVVAKATHEYEDIEIVAIKVITGVCEGQIGIMNHKGFVAVEETIRFQDMKVGQTVKLVNAGEGHLHWKFELNKETVVGKREDGRVGPKDKDGDIPWCNFAGWEFVLVKDAVIGKPKLPTHKLAELTPDAEEVLLKYAGEAPEWATHVGSDSYGVHFFDHQPHVYKESLASFLKGLLPHTHKHQAVGGAKGSTNTLKVAVLPTRRERKVEVAPEPTKDEVIAKLKVEVVQLKAKLFNAESKVNQIKRLVAE